MERSEYNRRYYEKHREQINKKNLDYYRANKEKVLERQREYYIKNKEKFAEKGKKYYDEHSEYVKARQKIRRRVKKEELAMKLVLESINNEINEDDLY